MLLVPLRSTSFTICVGPASVISMHDGIFEKKKVSHNASILPSFQYFNALICNILIFGIIFNYDFLQFWLIYGLRVLQRSQNRRIRLYSNVWNLWASGGSAPWTVARGVAPGPHADLRFTFLAPPLQKTFRGPWDKHQTQRFTRRNSSLNHRYVRIHGQK